MRATFRRDRVAPLTIAAIFAASGITHLLKPSAFDSLMPRAIPEQARRPLIYASGVAEVACAAGLARNSKWARGASAALLVAVFPANVQVALDAGSGRQAGAMNKPAAAWGRLPVQAAMIWAATRRSAVDR